MAHEFCGRTSSRHWTVILLVLSFQSLRTPANVNFPFVADSPPKTMTCKWQEASNEKALEEKQNPFTGMLLAFFTMYLLIHLLVHLSLT